VVRQFRKLAQKKLISFFFNHDSFWLVELSAAVASTYAGGWEEREHLVRSTREGAGDLLAVSWDHASSTASGSRDPTGLAQHRASSSCPVLQGPSKARKRRILEATPAVFKAQCQIHSSEFCCAKPQLQLPQTLLFCGRDSQDASSFNNLLYIAAADSGTYLICDLTAPVKQTVTPSRLILSITEFSFLLSSAKTSFLLL